MHRRNNRFARHQVLSQHSCRNRRGNFELLEDRTLLSITSNGIPNWSDEQGPGPIFGGQALIGGPAGQENPVVGGVQAMVTDPTNPDLVYIGTVNGGVWKATAFTSADPQWEPLTDNMPVVSISTLARSPLDSTPGNPSDDTLFAGTGRISNTGRGAALGILRSQDGGTNWSLLNPEEFEGLSFSSVVPTGVTSLMGGQIVLAATSNVFTKIAVHKGGLYRSTDGGDTWSRLSAGGAGLPVDAGVSELVGDPGNVNRFYAAVPGKGIFRSLDAGFSWQSITNDLPAAIVQNSIRIRLSVSPTAGNPLFASFIQLNKVFEDGRLVDKQQLSGVFRSFQGTDGTDNNGAGGTDEPAEAKWKVIGTAPAVHPGGQGRINFSLVADNLDGNRVFVGGDRQANEPFVANLFVGDATTDVWVPLFQPNLPLLSSAPHADSRNMMFDNNGNLIEMDDGGIYRRTLIGWQSLNSGLRNTEFYSVAYDPLNDDLIGGSQDTAVSQQTPDSVGSFAWQSPFLGNLNAPGQPTDGEPKFAQGDGSFVAVDSSDPTQSIRYFMGNNFSGFFRTAFDATDKQVDIGNTKAINSATDPLFDRKNFQAATVMLASPATPNVWLSGLNEKDHGIVEHDEFDQIPFALNAIDPKRMLIGRNGLYESIPDKNGKGGQGDIIQKVTPVGMDTVTALAYGGFEAGFVAAPDVAVVGAGDKLFLRRGAGQPFIRLPEYNKAGGSDVLDVVFDPQDWHTVYVTDSQHVFRGKNVGDPLLKDTWEDITGSLKELFRVNQVGSLGAAPVLRSLTVTHQNNQVVLFAGGLGGIYRLIDPGTGTKWTLYGEGLPNVVVNKVLFDETDDVLIAGTRGRGAWKLNNASADAVTESELVINFENATDTIRLVRDANNPLMLDVIGATPQMQQFKLSTIGTITVNGQGGTNNLIVDSSHGVIDVPNDIVYFGGGGKSKLTFAGAAGQSLFNLPTSTTSGNATVVGSGGSRFGGVVFYSGLGSDVLGDPLVVNNLPSAAASPLDILRNGIDLLDPLFRDAAQPTLLGLNLPVLGQSLDKMLSGMQIEEPAGETDEAGGEGAAAAIEGADEVRGTSIWQQLIETGEGAFSLDDIGVGITTLEQLRAAFDGLDTQPGNVTLAQVNGVATFDVTVRKTLTGPTTFEIQALGGGVDLGGIFEISADVTLHLIFGVDAGGFFIDANANPDPTLVINNISMDGEAQGDGRFGFTEVEVLGGSLSFDPKVELAITLREPGVDPFTSTTDGKIRPYEFAPLTDQLATAELTQNLNGDDVVFTATMIPEPLHEDEPNLLGLPPSEVTMTWADVTNLSQGPSFSSIDGRLLPFIDIVANQLTFGGMETGRALHRLSQTDGNVLSEDLALTGTSVGEILDSPTDQVHPVELANSSILHVSPLFEDADFKRFEVTVADVNLPQQGVVVGDAVTYKDQNGNTVDGTVDSVGLANFVVRFNKASTQLGPHASTPSLVIVRSGSVEHQLAAFLNPLVDQSVFGLAGPTLQQFVESLAAFSGVDLDEIEVTGDLSGANPLLQIAFDLKPAALTFDQKFDLGANLQGASFSTGSDFAFTFAPSYRLELGLDMRSGISGLDRFFTVGDAAPAISFEISADLDVPSAGYGGQIGYLNVGLTPSAANNGAQIDGTFSVGLTDPGTLAQDGRISLSELQLPNPSATTPTFKIARAGGELSISDSTVVKIEDAEATANLNKFTVTLASAGLLSGVAVGNAVSYQDNSGRDHSGSIDSLSPDGLQFTVSYSVGPLFAASVDADFNIDALKIKSNVSNSTSNLGDLIVSLDGTSGPAAPGHVTSLADMSALASQIQFQGNKQGFLDYLNLSPDQIFTALKLLATRLADLSGKVDVDLPLLNFDISSLTYFQSVFSTKIQSLTAAQIPSAQALVTFLRTQFPALTLTLNGTDLQFSLALAANVDETFPISVDIGSGSLTGNGQVRVVGQGNLNLGVGFSTAPNLDVPDRFFLSAGGSNGFSASLQASAGYDVDGNGSVDSPALQFSAGVGPLSVNVKDGRVLLNNVQFAATIQGGSDANAQRLTLREITDNIGSNPASIITGGFNSGSLQAVLPIDGNGGGVDPIPSNLAAGDAWIDVAGLITNLGSPAINTDSNVITHHTGFGGTPTVDKPLDSSELNFGGTPLAGKFVVSAYNVDSLLNTLVNFDPGNIDLKGGLDNFLGNLENNLLGGPILDLPFLGKEIKKILGFVDDMQDKVSGLQSGDENALQLFFESQFGAGNVNVVQPGPNDFQFQLHVTGNASLPIDLTGSLGIPGLDLSVDSGSFNLSSGYDFHFNFGFSKNDGFYIDTGTSSLVITFSATITNFQATGHLFFLQVDVNKNLPAAQIKPITIGGGELKVDLHNPFSSNSRLTLTELTSGGFDPFDLFGAKLKLSTDIPLHLKVSFNGDKSIPSISTDFAFHWDFLNADSRSSTLDFGGMPAIAFNNVTLDLGSFVNQFVQPIMDVVNDILDPIRPIIDTLNTRLPGFSDLPDGIISTLHLDDYDHNKEVSLLDFAQKYLGDSEWGVALKVFQYIDSTSRSFKTSEVGGLNLGSFVISTGTPGGFDIRGLPDLSSFTKDPIGAAFKTAKELVNDHLSDTGAEGFVKRFLKDSITNVSQELGGKRLIELPIIENPTSAFNLLLGRDVNLALFNPPRLDIPLQVDMIFGLFGILGVRVVGGVKATVDFRFGFDTFGLREFLKNPSDGPQQIFDGFYTTNRANADGTGDKVPQVLVDARVTIGGGVDVFVASASVNGGIYTRGPGSNPFQMLATLCDDKQIADDGNPGKLRFRDLHGFEMQGDLRAGIFAEVTIGKWPLKHTEIFPFTEKVLINLNHPCEEPEPILANFASPAPGGNGDLANLTKDGVEVYNDNANGPVATLRLNIGPRAGERKHKLTTDISEVFIVNHVDGVAGDETVDVIAFGTKQRYYHVKDIFGDGGDDDDTITLQRASGDGKQKGVQSFALLLGGPGNDNLNAGDGPVILFGFTGNDSLYGGPQDDLIYGEQDNDVIVGGAGNDRLIGGSKDRTGGAKDDGADFIVGGDGDDRIAGDNANFDDVNNFLVYDDTANNKFGDDRIFGGKGKDTIFGTSGNDEIYGEDDDDDIRAGRGNDLVSGGLGNDTLVGARGEDILNGNEGNDYLEGGLDKDQLYGSQGNDRLIGDQASLVTTDTSSDLLDGGDGDDILLGDNGTIDAQGIVAVAASGANDTLRGGDGADRMYGQGGDDYMEGGLGADAMYGADGKDTMLGQRDADYAEGNEGSDAIQGGPGADRLLGGSTSRHKSDDGDNIIGDEGNDWILGDNGIIDVAQGKVQTYDDGKGGKDTIFGGADDDIIFGGTGGDDLTGDALNQSGNDILVGDDGSATLTLIVAQTSTASGNDNIFGSGGNDVILGGDGKDVLTGDAGSDVILGDNGKVARDSNLVVLRVETADPQSGDADQISGGNDSDVVLGGTGGDTIDGGQDAAADILLGDNGKVIFNDPNELLALRFTIFSTDPTQGGVDLITGGAGDDTLVGGALGDKLYGGKDADLIVGDDAFIQRSASGAVLRTSTIDPSLGGNDVIEGNEGGDTALGGFGDDVILGGDDDAADILIGDNGVVVGSDGSSDANDIFTTDPTFGGVDTIAGGPGNDTMLGGSGNADLADPVTCLGSGDFMFGNDGNDILVGDNGKITRNAALLVERIETTYPGLGGNDNIDGNHGEDLILGGFGADQLTGHTGNDVILGDNGALYSAIAGSVSSLTLITTTDPTLGCSDTIYGNEGNDTLMGGTDSETIDGGAGDDLIFGDHGKVDLTLPPERNFFSIDTGVNDGGAADFLYGNVGDDRILGGQGGDQIYGQDDDDDLIGGHNVPGGADGSDIMDGGRGNDSLTGDNASIIRRGDTISPLIRVLTGATLYDATGAPAVTSAFQLNPLGVKGRDVVIFDAASGAPAYTHGDDYMAGGSQHDTMFGQAGNDIMQGDGSVALIVSASQPSTPDLGGAGSDGDDYLEGNAGDDVLYGDLGQDDLIGGSSDLFGQTTADQRGDGADVLFGGAGTDVARNTLGDTSSAGHARDADAIVGDNGAIYRIVGINGASSGAFLKFQYDNYGTLKVVPRVIKLLDYTLGGAASDLGAGDLIHGEAGDDSARGGPGGDIIFGEGQDDDLFGQAGNDWISGGAGEDGIVGDDGRISTSRNGLTETLYGLTTPNAQTQVSMPGPFIGAWTFITGRLNKSVELEAYTQGGDDVIYGGLGDDFLHGGAGNDGISGAEATGTFYANPQRPTTNFLGYDPLTRKLAAYDAVHPFTKIPNFLLNFDATDAQGAKVNDGKDRLFGDLGNDWLVGGTQNDRLFGGMGDDLMNLDDNQDTPNNNEQPDPVLFADRDFAYGGGGLDVLIANTGGDRMFDSTGEFNSFLVPFAPFGEPTIIRQQSPQVDQFLRGLARESGNDFTLPEPALHLDGELGLTSQEDPEWGDQHGGPRDPQPGHVIFRRDTQGSPEDDRDTALPLALPLGLPVASASIADNSQDAALNNVIVTQDPDNVNQRALFVGGSAGNDVIEVRRGKSTSYIKVSVNGVSQEFARGSGTQSINRVVAYGNGGNDTITAFTDLDQSIKVVLFGGDGNDTLRGGNGANFIDGGEGDDTIYGGTGADVLVGGRGRDTLRGGAGGDLLIGGLWMQSEDLFSIANVVTTWTSTASRPQRVSTLKAGVGPDGQDKLNTSTVFDDGLIDSVFGEDQDDWFWLFGQDQNDKRSNDVSN